MIYERIDALLLYRRGSEVVLIHARMRLRSRSLLQYERSDQDWLRGTPSHFHALHVP